MCHQYMCITMDNRQSIKTYFCFITIAISQVKYVETLLVRVLSCSCNHDILKRKNIYGNFFLSKVFTEVPDATRHSDREYRLHDIKPCKRICIDPTDAHGVYVNPNLYKIITYI